MAQRRGTFLLRRAGQEQKSGLTPGHRGDPVPEKICSDTGFCCAQFRVSPACISPLLMGKESAIVRRARAPRSLPCSRVMWELQCCGAGLVLGAHRGALRS